MAGWATSTAGQGNLSFLGDISEPDIADPSGARGAAPARTCWVPRRDSYIRTCCPGLPTRIDKGVRVTPDVRLAHPAALCAMRQLLAQGESSPRQMGRDSVRDTCRDSGGTCAAPYHRRASMTWAPHDRHAMQVRNAGRGFGLLRSAFTRSRWLARPTSGAHSRRTSRRRLRRGRSVLELRHRASPVRERSRRPGFGQHHRPHRTHTRS